jgi:hypothetical protein
MASAKATSPAAKTDSPFVSFATFCSIFLGSLLWAAKRSASCLASILEHVVRNPVSKFAIRRGDIERWHPPTTSPAAKTDSPFVSFATFCSNSLGSLLWATKRSASSLASILELVVRNAVFEVRHQPGDLERWHPPNDVAGQPKLIPPLFPLIPSVQILFARFCGRWLRAVRFKIKPSTPSGGRIKRCQ